MTRDEYVAVLDSEPITPNQRGRIMAECERLGLDDRAERLAVLAALLGLGELESTRDLTQGQGGQIVRILICTRDRAQLPGAPMAATGEHQAAEPVAREPRGDWITRLAAMIYAATRGLPSGL